MKPKDIQPTHISDQVWFYAGRTGLDFVVESRTPEGALVSVEQFRLTWRRLNAGIKQHGRAVTPAPKRRRAKR